TDDMTRGAVPFVLRTEHEETSFHGIADGMFIVPIFPAVKGRIADDDSALESRDRLFDHLVGDRAGAKSFGELLAIGGISIQLFLDPFQGVGHLNRILHRPFGLLLQTGCAAIPKLHVKVGRVQDRRRITAALFSAYSSRNRAGIGEAVLWRVARGTGDSVVDGEYRIVIKTPTK